MKYKVTKEDESVHVLAHHGVKGMKWGVRNAKNPLYSDQQRKRDSQVYGRRGVKRINRAMNKGDKVSTARSFEKTKRDRVQSKSKYVRQGGKAVGAAVGVATGIASGRLINNVVKSPKGKAVLNKVLGDEAGAFASAILGSPAVMVATSAGAIKVADMFSGDVAVSAYERVHGYKPYRK